MNLCTKQKQTKAQKTNLWFTKGESEGGREGQISSMGLTDTNYYT